MKKRKQDILYDEMIKLIESNDQEKFKELLLVYSLVMFSTVRTLPSKVNMVIENIMNKYNL